MAHSSVSPVLTYIFGVVPCILTRGALIKAIHQTSSKPLLLTSIHTSVAKSQVEIPCTITFHSSARAKVSSSTPMLMIQNAMLCLYHVEENACRIEMIPAANVCKCVLHKPETYDYKKHTKKSVPNSVQKNLSGKPRSNYCWSSSVNNRLNMVEYLQPKGCKG